MDKNSLLSLTKGIPLDPLPAAVLSRDPSVPHAPKRTPNLTKEEFRVKHHCAVYI